MKMIKRIIMIKNIVLGVAMFLGGYIFAQDTLRLNIELCREMALENSKVLKIAEVNIEKAKGEKRAARSTRYPNISASATGVFSQQEIQTELILPTKTFDLTTGELSPNLAINPVTNEVVTDADGNPVFNSYAYLPLDITLKGFALAGVSAEQPIYAGGKINAGNRMAKLGEQMALENRALKEDNVLMEVERHYYTVLSVKAKLKLAQEYTDLLKAAEKMVKDSYETGMVNRNELLKVQVQYNEALLQVQKAKSGLMLSQMALLRVIGADLFTPIALTDNIENVAFKTETIDDFSVASRKEYQLLQKQLNLADEQLKMVKGNYLPTVGVSLAYNYYSAFLDGMDNYDSDGFSAIANVKIPITTFGERKGKMASAKADYDIKQLELAQARDLLLLEIEQARLNYEDAWVCVEMTRKALDQAEENMKVSDDNYDLGMETIVNVLEAKAEWQKAYSEKIDALTDFKIKERKYLKVTNQME